MEISEIKTRLTLAEVLQHYNLKPDKHMRLNCPFHEDKTPSFQVYYKTHTAYCFSSNCKTKGKSLDVIDFIMHKESSNKHQAIEKCKVLINGDSKEKTGPLTKSVILMKMYTYFKNGVHNSPPAKEYIQSRNLDYTKLEIGYNTGQSHHGARKEENLINQCLQVGLLKDAGILGRTGNKAYKPFAKYCIVFALRNKQNHVTGLYFRSTINDTDKKHYYLQNREGLYPHYPNTHTKKLILTEAIIDAASLLMNDAITSHYEILSAYGTNGLTTEHTGAIKELKELEEIIFFFDGDKSGKAAVNKYGSLLQKEIPQVKITVVNTPDKEDINSLLQGHTPEILQHLINERTGFIFSTENNLSLEIKNETTKTIIPKEIQEPQQQTKDYYLNTSNPHNILFTAIAANYQIKGGIKTQWDSLKISLQVIHKETKQDYRCKIDLYEYRQTQATAKQAADLLNLQSNLVEKDLSILTKELEQYREAQSMQEPVINGEKPVIKVGESTQAKCIYFMKQANLIQRYNEGIGQAGVIGEEKNRIMLFAIASSYKMQDTLHALIQGSSGSGKTTLLTKILALMPPEDVICLTRVTDSSFYNFDEYELQHRLFGMEDMDGMEEKALLAFRELISREQLVSSTSYKDENGNIKAKIKIVRGPIASLSATTKGEIYEDNMSRCFLVAVDESKEQTGRIIEYQNTRAAGLIDTKKEKEIREFIQNCIRLLKPYEVINPFANKIKLPEEAHKIRRLNELYQAFVKQVTLLNQYQRSKDEQDRLISTKEDLQIACEIMFESILLKVDELDGSLRQFYEQLKTYVEKKGKDYEFTRIEIRQHIKISKTLQHNYINRLTDLEYIRQSGGYVNRGYHYKIAHWDNIAAVKAKIKDDLQNQLQQL